MKNVKIKKLLILNIPYILLGLFATNLGEAWRLAEGADMVRMFALAGGLTNLRMYRSKRRPRRNAWVR